MTGRPLVSIVMCTYNGEAYLPEQLNSLEQQTYSNLEIICSDNNSTDKTPKILKDWCAGSDHRHFLNVAEIGLNKNFFQAIASAKGEYIIFCDQDDIWMPRKVEKLVLFHQQHPHASLVYCLSKPFSGLHQPAVTTVLKNSPVATDIKQTLLISFTLGHNILIRRKILDQIPDPGSEIVAYDWWITVSAMCLGPIQCLQEELTFWRQHPRNTTKVLNKDRFFESREKFLSKFATHSFISKENKVWINEARQALLTLRDRRFSFPLFKFLLLNAPIIFFYKRKKTILSKWVSYVKWSLRMSRHDYRP